MMPRRLEAGDSRAIPDFFDNGFRDGCSASRDDTVLGSPERREAFTSRASQAPSHAAAPIANEQIPAHHAAQVGEIGDRRL